MCICEHMLLIIRTVHNILYKVGLSLSREHNRSAEDKQTYQQWVETMEPIYNNIFHFTRVSCRAILITAAHL